MPRALRRAVALVRTAVALAGLAPSRRQAARTLAIALLMPVKRRIAPLRGRPVCIRVGPAPGRPFWFGDRSELRALEEVFVKGEYDLDLPAPPAVIVDLGANAGQASLYFRLRYPEARIIAVEPDPSALRHLERNLCGDSNAVVRRHAVSPRHGPVRLARYPDESWKTRVTAAADETAVTVRGATLDELFAEERLERVDLLKIDIEGLELDVLSTSPALGAVDTVIGELHYWMLGVDREEALQAMQANGRFTRARFVDHHLFLLTRNG